MSRGARLYLAKAMERQQDSDLSMDDRHLSSLAAFDAQLLKFH
jgi:hypothetical protein